MTSESGSSEERQWLVEPPGPNEIRVEIAAGDQVEITDESRQAFDNLLEAIGGGQVEGYTQSEPGCEHYLEHCDYNLFNCIFRGNCNIESRKLCEYDYHCVVHKPGA
jgi:hypothetical protein